MSKKQQIDEEEDELVPIEDILDQLDQYEKDPPPSSRNEPFAYNDLLPMMRMMLEHMLDTQDAVDELFEAKGTPPVSPLAANGGNVALPPGFIPFPEHFVAQTITLLQTVGYQGAMPNSQIPLDVQRQLCRSLFCQISGMLASTTTEVIMEQMKVSFPGLDSSMPDVAKYYK